MEQLHATTIATAAKQQQQPLHGWKEWTNKNIFASSIDETIFVHGYQDQETIDTENTNVQGCYHLISISLSFLLLSYIYIYKLASIITIDHDIRISLYN